VEAQVRTGKEGSEQVKGTHFLESAEKQVSTVKESETEEARPKSTHTLERDGSTRQDAKKASEGHSQTGEGRERDVSGHGNKLSERGALTSWRAEREKQVITQKQSGRAAGTHELESAEG